MSESYAAGRSYNTLLVTQNNLDISTFIMEYIGGIQAMPDITDFCKHSFESFSRRYVATKL